MAYIINTINYDTEQEKTEFHLSEIAVWDSPLCKPGGFSDILCLFDIERYNCFFNPYGYWISNLFESVCDLLTIDYNKLSTEIENFIFRFLENDLKEEKKLFDQYFHKQYMNDSQIKEKDALYVIGIAEILLKYDFLLLDNSITDELFDYYTTFDIDVCNNSKDVIYKQTNSIIKHIFSGFEKVILYIDHINENKKLQDPYISSIFFSQVIGAKLDYYGKKIEEFVYYNDYLQENDKEADTKKDIVEYFLQSLDQRKNQENTCFSLICYSTIDFLCSTIHYALEKKYTIKRCANCGKIFIAYNRSDTLYCNRPSPQDENLTCKEYGSKKMWYERMKADETAKLCRNIYARKQMLSRRNPDIKEYLDDFEKFKIESKQWKKDVKSGIKTKEEFLAWLKNLRKKD